MDKKVSDIIERLVTEFNLLERKPLKIDNDEFSAFFTGQTILITGAAGSIGSKLELEISKFHCKVILLDIAESALYELQQELIANGAKNFEIVICDVRNKDRLEQVIFLPHSFLCVSHCCV